MIFKLWMILKVAWAAAKFRMQKTLDTSDLAKTEGWLRARLLKAFLAANTIDEQLHCSWRVCVCVCVVFLHHKSQTYTVSILKQYHGIWRSSLKGWLIVDPYVQHDHRVTIIIVISIAVWIVITTTMTTMMIAITNHHLWKMLYFSTILAAHSSIV